MAEPSPMPVDPAAPAGDALTSGEPEVRRAKSARAKAGGGKRKKAELPSADEVRSPAEQAAERRAWRVAAVYAVVVVGLLVGSWVELTLHQAAVDAMHLHVAGLIAAACMALFGTFHVHTTFLRGRLAGARALIDAELWDPAIPALKALATHSQVEDEAAYLVALAYDRQGARRLALESYRSYLKRHRRGVWAVEATVRVEELEAQPSPSVQALVREAGALLVCPYCRAGIVDDAVTVECGGCATPHHIGCYEEQGGCSVYGCASKSGRARERA